MKVLRITTLSELNTYTMRLESKVRKEYDKTDLTWKEIEQLLWDIGIAKQNAIKEIKKGNIIDMQDTEKHMKQLMMISQNGQEFDNPSISLHQIITDTDEVESGSIVLSYSDGDTYHYLLDEDEKIEALNDPSEYLKSQIEDIISNSDDGIDQRLQAILWNLKDIEFFEAKEDYEGKCKIIQIKTFYGSYSPIGYVDNDRGDDIIFDDKNEAQAWIDDIDKSIYSLSHNEAGRPAYIIVPEER